MMNAYIAFRATVQVTHVRNVLLELALYFLHVPLSIDQNHPTCDANAQPGSPLRLRR